MFSPSLDGENVETQSNFVFVKLALFTKQMCLKIRHSHLALCQMQNAPRFLVFIKKSN